MKCATVPACAKGFWLSAYERTSIETIRKPLSHPGTLAQAEEKPVARHDKGGSRTGTSAST